MVIHVTSKRPPHDGETTLYIGIHRVLALYCLFHFWVVHVHFPGNDQIRGFIHERRVAVICEVAHSHQAAVTDT